MFRILKYCSIGVLAISSFAQATTEEQLRAAIIAPDTYTDCQFESMDRNTDGKVDVADLVSFTRTNVTAEFDQFNSEVTEGTTSQHLVRVNFSKTFQGDLKYQISNLVDNSLSEVQTISVDGGFIDIPVTVTDDQEINPAKILNVALLVDEECNPSFSMGSSLNHQVTILDNDSVWLGNWVTDEGFSIGFKLKILKDAQGTSGSLIADSYSIIPKNHDTNSTEWALASLQFSDTSLNVETVPILVKKNPNDANASEPSLFNKNITRTLEFKNGLFSTQTNDNGNEETVNTITGDYLEVIEVEGAEHLERTITGKFQLIKQLVEFQNINTPLI